MNINVRNIKSVRADGITALAPGGWLELTDRDGNEVTIFMDRRLADALEAAWHDYHDDEPTPPTYDDALATKCDAEARNDEAMKLKGMV